MREKIHTPSPKGKVLLHTCCATCMGEILDCLLFSEIACEVFYYNPNTYPANEYQKRKQDVMRYSRKRNIPFIEGEYNPSRFLNAIKGFENEPEKGKRCEICFRLRLREAASYAHHHGFKFLTSTLGISRWKDFNTTCRIGKEATESYPDLYYWDYNWRKNKGEERTNQIAKEEHFYRQSYCGCMFSLKRELS